MRRLSDYRGDFNPDIKLEDFSKDALLKLTKLYSQLYVAIDGFWFLSVMNRISNDVAIDCDLWVWKKQIKYEMDRVTKLLGIQGNDIVALFKAFQFGAWSGAMKYRMETINDTLGVLTVLDCPTVAAMEREGKEREAGFCKTVEQKMFDMYANYFNPNIQVKYLELPPRKNKDGIFCRWEFRLEKHNGV